MHHVTFTQPYPQQQEQRTTRLNLIGTMQEKEVRGERVNVLK